MSFAPGEDAVSATDSPVSSAQQALRVRLSSCVLGPCPVHSRQAAACASSAEPAATTARRRPSGWTTFHQVRCVVLVMTMAFAFRHRTAFVPIVPGPLPAAPRQAFPNVSGSMRRRRSRSTARRSTSGSRRAVGGTPFRLGRRHCFICLPLRIAMVSPSQRPNGGISVLVFTRKVGESVRIGADVKVTVLGVRGAPNQVRIGVSASPDVAVHREEVFERIRERAEARAGTRQEGSDTPGDSLSLVDYAPRPDDRPHHDPDDLESLPSSGRFGSSCVRGSCSPVRVRCAPRQFAGSA